ncbi:hypothetical protein DID80_00595 [Candidatus Marinamargulisbacteria bacterium SCGC AAA071-K20]|nr:hypothetical protein DID80_00595 [Candidatus Marinamargulisbacteria bacterium SCGC AAA071-K20]
MFNFLGDLFSSFFSLFSGKASPTTKPKETDPNPFGKSGKDFVEVDTPTGITKDENNLFTSSDDEIEGIEDGSA